MNGTMQRELVALIEVALFNFVDKVYQTILFSPYRFRKKEEGGGEGEGRGEEKIPCIVISKLHHFCTMPLLLLAFEHRLNPLRSLYRENVLNILGKEGIFGGEKKKGRGEKKKKEGEKRWRKKSWNATFAGGGTLCRKVKTKLPKNCQRVLFVPR